MSDLLKSKRLWVLLFTLSAHLLAKYHVVLSDVAVNDLADQLVLVAGAAGIVVSKIMDSRKAPAPPAVKQP